MQSVKEEEQKDLSVVGGWGWGSGDNCFPLHQLSFIQELFRVSSGTFDVTFRVAFKELARQSQS